MLRKFGNKNVVLGERFARNALGGHSPIILIVREAGGGYEVLNGDVFVDYLLEHGPRRVLAYNLGVVKDSEALRVSEDMTGVKVSQETVDYVLSARLGDIGLEESIGVEVDGDDPFDIDGLIDTGVSDFHVEIGFSRKGTCPCCGGRKETAEETGEDF
jgi:hypothetical protein